MGSAPSQPIDAPSSSNTAHQAAASPSPAASPAAPPSRESGYARAKRKCLKKQRLYDACYTAALSSKEEDCGELFEAYRTCFLKWMHKDMERRGVRVSEGSLVGEFLEEEEEDNR